MLSGCRLAARCANEDVSRSGGPTQVQHEKSQLRTEGFCYRWLIRTKKREDL